MRISDSSSDVCSSDLFGPGKKVQPSCPHTLQQRSRNCFRVGAVVGSTGKTNGADSPFTQCLHSAGIRPETDSAHILDPIREQRLHCGRVYWSGREYPRTCRTPLHLTDRQPFLSGEGRERIKTKGASPGADQILPIGIAASGYPVRNGMGEADADISDRKSTRLNSSH